MKNQKKNQKNKEKTKFLNILRIVKEKKKSKIDGVI